MTYFESSFVTIISLSAPLIFIVIGETITERSGVVNLSVEGTILLTALTAFAVAVSTNNASLGVLSAGLIGSFIALVIVLCDIRLSMNQIAVGFVLTILCGKLSSFLGQNYVRIPGPSLPKVDLPILKDIPYIGPSLFNQNILVLLSVLLIPTAWFFLYRTRFGLNLRSVGENPTSSMSRGINPELMRILGTLIGGFLIGVGGAAFSLHAKYGWSEGHTGNYGWICLAIVIFGGWNPIRAALGAYAFGAFQLIALKMQSVTMGFTQVLPLIPFPLMIMTLIFIQMFNGEKRRKIPVFLKPIIGGIEPGALGKPLSKEK